MSNPTIPELHLLVGTLLRVDVVPVDPQGRPGRLGNTYGLGRCSRAMFDRIWVVPHIEPGSGHQLSDRFALDMLTGLSLNADRMMAHVWEPAQHALALRLFALDHTQAWWWPLVQGNALQLFFMSQALDRVLPGAQVERRWTTRPRNAPTR